MPSGESTLDLSAFEDWCIARIPVGGAWADDDAIMQRVVALSSESVAHGGGPFGAVIAAGVREGTRLTGPWRVLSVARNQVVPLQDFTAHAEMECFRRLCRAMGAWDIAGGESDRSRWNLCLFTSGFPCIGCAGWIKQARGLARMVYAATSEDIQEHGGFFEGRAGEWRETLRGLSEHYGVEVAGPTCRDAACAALREYKSRGGVAYTGVAPGA